MPCILPSLRSIARSSGLMLHLIRITGLLTAGRNPGDRTYPGCQPLTTEGTSVTFKGQLPPRPLDCGLSPLPRRMFFAIGAEAQPTTGTGGVASETPSG